MWGRGSVLKSANIKSTAQKAKKSVWERGSFLKFTFTEVFALAHSTVDQTSTFNNLGPISSRLRFGDTKEFIILSTNFQIFGNLATPELTRSASSARISKFDPPLDAQGPVLSSTSGQHKYLPLTSNLFRFAAELWESGE